MSIPHMFPACMRHRALVLGQRFGDAVAPGELPPRTHPCYLSKLASVPDKEPADFQVCLDVQQFAPEEISVKTVGRQVVVEAEHEEKQDEHGSVYRRFLRKYSLPEGYEPHRVVSAVSSDGVLTVSCPGTPITLADRDERIVPVQHTGPSHSRPHKVHHENPPRQHHRFQRQQPVILAIKYI